MVEQVGRYKIKGQLGRGAMGIVYLADDPLLNRQAAIKTIDLGIEDAHQREFLRDRLLRDARAAAGLTHPNIVAVFDVVEEGDSAFLVMEYVDGETLAAVLNRSSIPDPAFTIRVLHDMAAALDYTHARGIIHRDIKPANVMIDASQTAKIMDFGIARIADTRTSTPTGMVMGTIEYMSPEQVKGETVDGRSDQFALAAVTYRLLTGATLFGQHSLATLAYKIVNEAPPTVRMRNAGLPFAVDAVVSRALSKSPGSRFPSCTEFVDALAGALALPSREESRLTMPLPAQIPAEPAPQIAAAATFAAQKAPAKKGWGPAMAVATALVLCAGGLAIWRPWKKPSAPPAVLNQTTDAAAPSKAVGHPNTPQHSVTPAKPDISIPATSAAVPNKPEPVPAKEPPAVTQLDETATDVENTSAEPAPPQTPHPAIDADKRGLELLKANQPRAAVGAFSKAIAIRPGWPRPYLNRGRAYQSQGDYDAAIRDYGQVLRMQPNNADAHALRGTAYLRLKDDGRASEDFNSALALKPDQSMALYGRGMVRLTRAAIRLALDDFNAAIRKSPNYVAAYTARGNAKRKLGDHAGADADFKKARELSGH